MIFDWRHRRICIGPYRRAGAVTLIRLWRWNYVSVGNRRVIARHVPEGGQ